LPGLIREAVQKTDEIFERNEIMEIFILSSVHSNLLANEV